ncbi:unnamed protein product [Ilex paraguariensis]|uniref:Uncharacterized protein n=1 Tax=Ilex paraguariensis TaxID=185542 RepID=A0ABC8T7E2_9AQUA
MQRVSSFPAGRYRPALPNCEPIINTQFRIELFVSDHKPSLRNPSPMAQVNIFKALVLAFIVAVVTASAQDIGSAPAPSPDAGAAFSLPVSGALIGTSLLLSVLSLFRH